MPKYAQYNPSLAAPSPVIGWYDTDNYTYPNLPAASGLLEITEAQWQARLTNPSGWAVSSGALVAYTPPAPVVTLAQAQTTALASLLASMNTFLTTKPDGSVRYDQNFINDTLIFALTNGVTTAPLPALLSWQKAVKSYYLSQQAAINAATTVSEAQAVDVSVAGFESKYGASGTVSTDPGITTAELA